MTPLYRLIRLYPGSPFLGATVGRAVSTDKWYSLCNNERFVFSDDEIENHPEFWEKINN